MVVMDKEFQGLRAERTKEVGKVEKRKGVKEIPKRHHEKDNSLRAALLYYTGELTKIRHSLKSLQPTKAGSEGTAAP